MKTRSSPTLVLLAVLGAAWAGPLASAASAYSATAVYRVLAVEYRGVLLVWPGDSTARVVSQLGQPDQKLSNDTWVYRRIQSRYDPRYEEDCTTLIVTFREGRVAALDRVNEPAVRWLAAKLAAPPRIPGIVAK